MNGINPRWFCNQIQCHALLIKAKFDSFGGFEQNHGSVEQERY